MPDPSDLSPARLDPGYFQEAVDRWRLEQLPLREVETLATLALTRDFDGPALRELAWPHDSWRDVDPLFPAAVAELRLAMPTRAEAIARLAGAIALDHASGRLSLTAAATAANDLFRPLRWDLAPDEVPAGFDPWELDALLDDWYGTTDHADRRLAELLDALLPAAAPRPTNDLSPALAPRPAPAPAPPPARGLRWRWPWQQ